MDVKKYIASGILELYVAGQLSEKENLEVHTYAQKYPEIQSEIEAIESAVLALSKTASPGFVPNFEGIGSQLEKEIKVVKLPEKKKQWVSYMGWAASIFMAIGLYWMYNQNQELKSKVAIAAEKNIQLEQQIADSNTDIEKSKELLDILRDKNITVVPLNGQPVAPTSYAKAYWSKNNQKVFIDVKGLPDPPDGMVYQVWSLKLDPLTPTSIGVLDDFTSDENKVFTLNNPNESEAFGITLETAGGSESPNLEQLYTLGTVSP